MTNHAALIARLEQDEARLRGLNEICSGLGGKCRCEGCQHRQRRADTLREAIAALTADRAAEPRVVRAQPRPPSEHDMDFTLPSDRAAEPTCCEYHRFESKHPELLAQARAELDAEERAAEAAPPEGLEAAARAAQESEPTTQPTCVVCGKTAHAMLHIGTTGLRLCSYRCGEKYRVAERAEGPKT